MITDLTTKIKVRWYGADGIYDGTEYTTLADLAVRIVPSATLTFERPVLPGKAFRAYRLSTGETARVFKRQSTPLTKNKMNQHYSNPARESEATGGAQ